MVDKISSSGGQPPTTPPSHPQKPSPSSPHPSSGGHPGETPYAKLFPNADPEDCKKLDKAFYQTIQQQINHEKQYHAQQQEQRREIDPDAYQY